MHKTVIILGALLSAFSVLLGAFGTHLLQPILVENGRENTFDTAITYLIFHSLGILMSGISLKNAKWIALFFSLGIFIFSGSLITLALINFPFIGVVTPFGGSCFVIGWILFARNTYFEIE